MIEPIRNIDALRRIRESLRTKPRDLLLFDLATQTGLGMKQLLGLKVMDVTGLSAGDNITLKQGRRRADQRLVISAGLHETIRRYLAKNDLSPDDFLFKSRKGGEALNLSSVSHLVKSWFEAAGLKDLSGAKSLCETYKLHFARNPQPAVETSRRTELKEATVLEPIIKTETLQEMVYKRLFQAIASGKIPPGERLVIEKLARIMNVSRIPVREALHRLEAAGMVSSKRARGLVVNELSYESMKEVLEIRILLEGMAAELAATRISDQEIERIETIYYQMEHHLALNQYDEYTHNNQMFHHGIYAAARLPILMQIIEGLWGRVRPYLQMLIELDGVAGFNLRTNNHLNILNSLKKRDPQGLSESVRADLRFGQEGFELYSRIYKGKAIKPEMTG